MKNSGLVSRKQSTLSRKVFASLLLLIIFFTGLAAGEGTETRISYNSSPQYAPAISGERIVWKDTRNCDVWCFDTYLYDIVTGDETSIRTESDICEHEMPAISGDYIVWQAWCSPDGYDIYFYNLSDVVLPERNLTENTPGTDQIAPAISGRWVAWKDMRDGTCDVYLYDILDPDTPASSIATDTKSCDSSSLSSPSISGDRVVWDVFDDTNGTYDVYLYEINQPTLGSVRISPSPIGLYTPYPSISGDYVVWQDLIDIYLYNISNMSIIPITNDSNPMYYPKNPKIEGNFVVWEEGVGNSQIFLYDIQNGSTFKITANANDHNVPAITGNRIVWEEYWTDGTNDDSDIYMFTIGESVPCPVADFVNSTPVLGNAPLTIGFLDQSSESPTSWIWDFGDGNTSREQNPFNTYTTPGTYDVTLAINTLFCRHVVEKTGFVSVENRPTANFSALPLSGYIPLEVNFTDLSTGSPTEWNWDFGDGIWLNTTDPAEKNPSHIYTNGGSYHVTLIVNNSFGTNALTKSSYISVLNKTGKIVSTNIAGLLIEHIGDRQFVSFDTSIFPEYDFTPPTTLWFVPPPETGIKNMTLYSADTIGFYNDYSIIKGNISSIVFYSEPIVLEGFSAETGTDCSLTYLINLPSYPLNSQITAHNWEGAIPSDYQLLLNVVYGADFAGITDVAYVVQLVKTNVNMLHNASIFLSVNSTWVENNGGRDKIWVIRIGDDQTGEVLPTNFLNHDEAKNLDYFRADSPRGLSKFALSALHGTGNPLQIVVLTAQQWFRGGDGGDDYGGGPIVTTTTRAPTPVTVPLTTLPAPEPATPSEPLEQVPLEAQIPTPTLPVIESPPSPVPTTKTPLQPIIPMVAWAAATGVLWLAKRRK